MTPQRLVLSVLLLVLLPGGLGAQERWLRGVVVRLGEHNEKLPEANTPVRLYGHGNRTHTDSHGALRLHTPGHLQSRGEGHPGGGQARLAYSLPPGGRNACASGPGKRGNGSTAQPKGSGVFLTHEALEKFILGLSEKAKQQVTPEGQPEKIDLSPLHQGVGRQVWFWCATGAGRGRQVDRGGREQSERPVQTGPGGLCQEKFWCSKPALPRLCGAKSQTT